MSDVPPVKIVVAADQKALDDGLRRAEDKLNEFGRKMNNVASSFDAAAILIKAFSGMEKAKAVIGAMNVATELLRGNFTTAAEVVKTLPLGIGETARALELLLGKWTGISAEIEHNTKLIEHQGKMVLMVAERSESMRSAMQKVGRDASDLADQNRIPLMFPESRQPHEKLALDYKKKFRGIDDAEEAAIKTRRDQAAREMEEARKTPVKAPNFGTGLVGVVMNWMFGDAARAAADASNKRTVAAETARVAKALDDDLARIKSTASGLRKAETDAYENDEWMLRREDQKKKNLAIQKQAERDRALMDRIDDQNKARRVQALDDFVDARRQALGNLRDRMPTNERAPLIEAGMLTRSAVADPRQQIAIDQKELTRETVRILKEIRDQRKDREGFLAGI
jgi:hypothetical protein